ncbi:alcohol dehydrogenase catalytic domain-containing protein [Cohnella sp. REN36]|uniref:alcohol dehydrogenase catalytic domain-containing protein n=1 Tax=Cohnella sp. REN36 TaxID=2887347 RepID=UPI001D15B0D9|nr:alcohol dehydrogenase catalytic domain-containing protein [Cohnella sp. REN36]MCC3372079.1 alcohol dehydrogenase catalytic domain-containing protein [Cohnella sp. REN36]
MKMKASVITGPQKSELVETDVPSIGDEEVLIRVKVCGVCASELHPWMEGAGWLEAPGKRPIFGHEPVGVIERMGARVEGFRIGDRVTGLVQHAFAQYAKANYRVIVKVPEELDDLEALGEPLSCLMSGASRTPVALGDEVAVVGAGFMGLGFLQLMRLKGAGRLIAVDTREESLEHARRFGAEERFAPQDVNAKYKVTAWAHMDQGIPGVQVAVEASGSQGGLQLAGEMAGVHGVLSIVGYHQGNSGMRNVNMELWNWKALTVINAHERRSQVHVKEMEAGLKLIAGGQLNMKDMITHVFSLDEVDLAYDAIRTKPPGFIKSVIKID